jgi:hypothetical protein
MASNSAHDRHDEDILGAPDVGEEEDEFGPDAAGVEDELSGPDTGAEDVLTSALTTYLHGVSVGLA